MNFELKGTIPALVTPFTEDGQVDYNRLRANVRFQIDCGVNGLVPLGTTGETPTLHDDEKEKIAKLVIEEAAGKIPVIVGAGTNSTETTINAAKKAEGWGADALLVVNPYYNKPTQKGLYLHFKAVAESVKIPIVVYNIKGRTGVNVDTITMAELAKIPNIVAVKEASGDINQMKEVLANTDLIVLSGDDGITLELMKEGGKGVISVAANLVPAKMVSLTNAALAGNWDDAGKIYKELQPLFDVEFIETNPIPIKAAMNMAGMAAGGYRLPLCEMMPENKEKLKNVLQEMKII